MRAEVTKKKVKTGIKSEHAGSFNVAMYFAKKKNRIQVGSEIITKFLFYKLRRRSCILFLSAESR